MKRLENQTVLIISPQPWDHLPISKHHYSLELAERGNRVFFLEPPDPTAPPGVHVRQAREHASVLVVTYHPRFPFVIRFHARPVYDRLIMWQIRAIRSALARPIDVVWSFDVNLFSNLKAFEPGIAIFHPVDPVSLPHQINVARSADVVFSVSDKILANFRHLDVPAWFINHGLSRPFEEAARNPTARSFSELPRRVGYAGNLRRPPVNRSVIRLMIEKNPHVEFHFWGPTDPERDSPADVREFLDFLRNAANVRLHGTVAPACLAQELQQMDCMVLTYSEDARESDRSNSHKILEYLSTGKVVVSSRISTYASQPDLMRMSSTDDDADLPAILRDTLECLDEFNSEKLQDQRRKFALENTYSKQLDRIEARLGK
jgi:glycosyltransferase involved in cell wall biosynthesis